MHRCLICLSHIDPKSKPRHVPAPPNLALDIEWLLGPRPRPWIDPQLVRLRPALRAPTLPLPIPLQTDQVGRVDRGDGGIAIPDVWWASRKAPVVVRSVLPPAGWSVRVRMRGVRAM